MEQVRSTTLSKEGMLMWALVAELDPIVIIFVLFLLANFDGESIFTCREIFMVYITDYM